MCSRFFSGFIYSLTFSLPFMPQDNIHPIHDKLSSRDLNAKISGSKGAVFWMCGLSGSGKSTLAIKLEQKLLSQGIFTVVLDGDNLRSGINKDLGFSDLDRKENIRRTSEIAKIFLNTGTVVIVSCITPLKIFRDLAQQIVGQSDYHEIYVKASYGVCRSRDVKGLYAKADKDEVSSFTGKGSKFEEPETPHLVLDTEMEDEQESLDKLLSFAKTVLSIE